MVKHFIILSSSYSEGKRIAMHYVMDDEMNSEMLYNEVRKVKELCGDTVSISTHYVVTDSPHWYSVVEKDAFFEDVYQVETLVQFIGLIKTDRELRGIDVAKYILAKVGCTHLKLEKLVYMCYADYLCNTGKKLFVDKIYAFRYGPVVESVYETYRGIKEIEEDCLSESDIEGQFERLPARSRILFAEDGIEKISYIDKTIERYGGLSVYQLVDITHVKGGPWDFVDKSRFYAEILDENIMENHYKEVEVVKMY